MIIKSENREEENAGFFGEKNQEKKELLLAALWNFHDQGRDDVSLAEFQESIFEFQKSLPSLRYSFSDRFMLSADLLSDLKWLDDKGYIRDYHCRLDGLLPKRFLSLTSLGRGVGKNVSQNNAVDL